ncbi:hypothetical protein MUK42_32000 [Musa troglodytarum]|uniref:Protein BIG GRAIN 1-like E n=1 Tax=Musa troglodytarum TaxID=320322 RepID=A0A9E7FP12_9LILI|nr:hypothetical protein MUK42_32000 [Musa troglodytarum]
MLWKMSRSRRWNDSGELDVFEAALYFSGEVTDVDLGLQRAWRAERRGLDTPTEATLFHQPRRVESQFKDKKHKQPCSPGGKLANLLSSFFHQAASKKKSKAVSPSQSFKDEEYPGKLARRRRNSINHPQSMRGRDYSKSIFSSDRRSGTGVSSPLSSEREGWYDKRVAGAFLLAERSKLITDGYAGNTWVENGSCRMLHNGEAHQWAEVFIEKEDKWGRRREEEEEDGGMSDSSSDLFELKSYDLVD